MYFLQSLLIKYRIKKIEKKLIQEQVATIDDFLRLPVIQYLQSYYEVEQNLQDKLSAIEHKRQKMKKSTWWGSNLYSEAYYWGDDEIERRLKEIQHSQKQIQTKLGFSLPLRKIDKLKNIRSLYRNKNELLSRDVRSSLVKSIQARKTNEKMASKHEEKTVKGLFLISLFDIGVKGTDNFNNSQMVYDAMRRVNSNYEGLSDTDIWIETFLLSVINPDSFSGLANQVKGAYFESVVAKDTGGILHEQNNIEGSDMMLDGELIQIKATDDASYIESVPDAVTVYATSEVASRTSAIDSGYSNEEITNNVENALGGDPFGTLSALKDGGSLFVGGFGVFAILKGMSSAGQYLEQNSPDKSTPESDNYNLNQEWDNLAKASLIGIESALEYTVNSTPSLWNLFVSVLRILINVLMVPLYPLYMLIR